MTINDGDPEMRGISSPAPDAHGRAALLLIESLIHGLCENSTLSPSGAVEIAERAADVQMEQAEEADEEADAMAQSHRLLTSIAASLKIDDRGGPSPPRLVV